VTSKELQEYLIKHKETVKSKIRGVFVVCGNMMQPVTQDLYERFFENHIFKITGPITVPQKVFLGRVTWGLMEPGVREQMKSLQNAKEYDNLKRSDCMDFGREILQGKL
jgi:hypothetical protein